ncbi:MAG: hypothetical protein HYX72_03855 [Acidobacteria bacterium]|nr:hypothetical protein [Acidobacteriota bacterium]
MGEMSSQIQGHIEQQRNELDRNVSDLQNRISRTFDWRVQMQERPITMMGIAFAGGALLGAVVSGQKVGGYASRAWREEPGPATLRERQRANDAWDRVKASLIGVGVSLVKQFFEQSIPGFREQYRRRASDSEAADFRQAPAA